MIKVTVTKGQAEGKWHYFYETEEPIVKCLECEREYKSRKYCLYCSKKYKKKINTIKTIKHHVGMITKDLTRFTCDCIFGSWFRWGKHWRDNYPKSRCKHCLWSMRKIKSNEKRKKNL